MEDGDGVKVSSCSGMEKRPSTPIEGEDNDSSKSTVVREASYYSNNHPQSIKFHLGFNSVNGDCGEKDANQLESSLAGSSSNNSFSSESSEVTHDSSPDDVVRTEADLSSDNSSKSSCSDSPKKSPNYSKTSDDLSSLHHIVPPLSESSDDSDSSESDDEATNRPETPNLRSQQSLHDLNEREESKGMDCSFTSDSEHFKKVECSSTEKDKNNVLCPEPIAYQLSPEESSQSSDDSDSESDKEKIISVKNDENQETIDSEQVPSQTSDNVEKMDIKEEASEVEDITPSEMKKDETPPKVQENETPSEVKEEMSELEDQTVSEVKEEIVSEVEDDEIPSDIKDDETPSDIKDDETQSDLKDDEMPLDIEDDETQSDVKDDEMPLDLEDDEAPSDIKDDEAPSDIKDDEAPSDIKDDETPSDIKDDETPSDLKGNGTPSEVSGNETPLEVKDNETLSGGKDFETSPEVKGNGKTSEDKDKETLLGAKDYETSSEVNDNRKSPNNETLSGVKNDEKPPKVKDSETLSEVGDKISMPSNETKESLGSSLIDNNILPCTNILDVKKCPDKEVLSKNISLERKSEEISRDGNLPEQKIVKDTVKNRQHVMDNLLTSSNAEKNLIKVPERINKNSRRKTEDRSTLSEHYSTDKFPIQYKGFKNIGNNLKAKNFKKSFLRWNPFNPSRKKDLKTGKYILQKHFRDDIDCSTLQPEYAQYLGLQPIVKFKCCNCGMSTFQSMSALNTHQIECKKNGKNISQISDKITVPDINSANIKLTRKVFLCSSCGTYYENCDLFLHMREYHRRYICLFCLYMGQSPESLLEHLKEKHEVVYREHSTLEDLQKNAPQSFFLLCTFCDRVFTEMDDSFGHKCSSKNSHENENNHVKRQRLDESFQNSSHDPSCHLTSDASKIRALKLNKDISMRPLNNTASNSDSCSLQNPLDSIDKLPNQTSATNENMLTLSSENCYNKGSLEKSESNPINPEKLQIKVPSDIEIKPLIPGENNNQESKFEPSNGSGIEIFPINTEPQKPAKKVRTLRTIKKRKPHIRTKVKFINKGRSITPIAEENECLDETFVPPISPPIIAPPPVVTDAQAGVSPSSIKQDPIEDMELADCHPPTDPGYNSQKNFQQKLDEEPSHQSPPSPMAVDDRSESPNQLEPDEHQQSTLESKDIPEMNRSLSQDIFKIKLKGNIESDAESDDSQKLSLIVDENTNNSDDSKKDNALEEQDLCESSTEPANSSSGNESMQPDIHRNDSNEVPLAREDIAAMALTLDDKIENVPIQAVVKECVRTSCLSCNYCRHAVKIAVNGKQLALHLLSEHRYTPVKNETNEDVVRKLKNSLETLQGMYFNTETYDSSDPSLHIPYDKESNFDCFQCSYVSSSHKDLYAHKRKFHTKSLLLCIMCKKNFFSYSELICHICAGTYNAESQVYSVDINFRCCFCRLDTIPSAFRLMVHLRKSHHTCDICLEMCSDQQKLSTHMWKHKLNHLCYRCGIAYASKPDITKHLFWKHGTESVLCKKCLQKKWPHVYHFCIPPTSFICEECNTSFSKAVALKVHKRIHGNDYPYSCTQCEKKFVSKKLLARHIDRHNAVLQKKESPHNLSEDNKDEIINVTDVVDCKETLQCDGNKEDGKDKTHKKHRKEKEKKEKKVVDVYDLPPLNLSSESDSSDDESSKKVPSKVPTDSNDQENSKDNAGLEKEKGPDMPKLDGIIDGDPYSDKSVESNSFLNLLKPDFLRKDGSGDESDRKPTASEPVSPFDSSVVNSLLPLGKDEIKNETTDSIQNEQVEGIWENFYKTNPQNSNLPFPLCAMKSDLAYSIIMGDHDYCTVKVEPVIKEDLPSTSNIEANLSGDKLEEVTPLITEKQTTPPPPPSTSKSEENPATPPSISKKKVKSPKKKVSKTPEDNNSSSSSDSSSDSDSSCSCGTNCSCCSSSSSSSSSSSDSDSSTNEDKKQDKRKKKKEKKVPTKSDGEVEPPKEIPPPEPEVVPLPEPEDPPIRESELETDESTSDEEFYDRQPQIIANQMLAEKRQMQLASGAMSNDSGSGIVAPAQATPPPPPPPPPPAPHLPPAQENIPPPDLVETPKPKPRAKRKRRVNTPKIEKPSLDTSFPKYTTEVKPPPFSPLFPHTPPVSKQKTPLPVLQSPSRPEASGSGSETDSTRISKRRRVPNKFYGYSSGDEEEKQVPKWRKTEAHFTPNQTPKMPPSIAPPPTPRIQLTVPKQVIRKPYHKQASKPKVQSSSDSSDSGTSDIDDRVPSSHMPAEPVKTDKDVYCYCRCPYDEVSEMIACDDVNCKIEWFHFECVGILVPPRGQWFCPGCRKARGLPT